MLGLKMVLRTADLLSVWMKRQQISVRLRDTGISLARGK